ncbi:probable ribonuclease ZC3H12C [Drosophila sulfurigaster albostrigata]|uniref:probable ribonuclease ZC3H12C n=1 Tax=Drosophila sulfurigaster albostrigata TaxID=89887 RepID=UPI002D218D38|nr:probable ribonuclease ZC3H12C [Drosophila sulfurigaster albostrigata]
MRIKMDCEVPEKQKHQQHQQQQQQQQQSANKLYARKPQTSQQQQQQQHQQESSDDDELSTTERKNLEFAQKLGYSEQSIHTALTRLGSEAKQNELLAELIKLTADAPRPPPANNNNNSSSSNSSSNNFYGSLRHIVIDGSNVALSHGNNTVFSCRGIRICVEWFRQRGHRHVTAFVPNWRKELANNNITEQELLYELEQERVLVFTPSRHLDGKRVSCYDDRFILKLAVETDGIVVSNDNYRDLLLESNEFRKVVQERLLMYSFVDDIFMPPDDPLGRSGPTLDMFLRTQAQQKMPDAQQQLCPYGKKCTYGQKCKFRHQSTTLQLQRLPLQVSHSAPLHSNSNGGGPQSTSSNCSTISGVSGNSNTAKLAALARTKSNTVEISQQQQQQLCHSFNSQLELEAESSQQLNRHKKLQRQAAPQPPTSAFRLLVPTYSAPQQQQQQTQPMNNSSYHHQYLTRTPSAPLTDQHQAAKLSLSLSMPVGHNLAHHLSASDSRINEELHSTQASREEQRRLLRYHLSSLFPQHQVHAVLQLYPDETDAKTICAAILNLFPHN